MNAQEIIEYIRTSEKKTPVKVYVWEKTSVDFPNCQIFSAAPGQKLVFGDWKDIAPVLEANEFEHVEIENNCRNSAIPMLDMKNIPARIEPGAIIREQVEIGRNAVIMMGAIINIGAVVGAVVGFVVGAVVGAVVLCVVSAQAVAGRMLSSIITASNKLVIRFFTNMYSFQFLCATIIADITRYCNLFFAIVTRLLPILPQKCFLFCIILGVCFHIFTNYVYPAS